MDPLPAATPAPVINTLLRQGRAWYEKYRQQRERAEYRVVSDLGMPEIVSARGAAMPH